ncbi:MAG: ABC transporter ATP-binding protein [Alphaproteobacteria bacterium]|nr:ABC transporter ATP-binding protein [Alphaproteobacteria bacterium]
MSAQGKPLLQLEHLSVAFAARGPDAGASRRFRAVDDVSLGIAPGEVLGLVGESGSGKTTLAKALLRLYKPAAGRIVFRGADLAPMGERALAPFRRDLQMVFQDPLSSFNPRHTVFEALAIPLRLHRICPRGEVSQRVDAILARVGLPAAFRDRFPHELSGGQLQRVAIGRALTLSPSLLVADEAVSKLDVSIRAQILNLLKDVRDSLGVSIIFITHDLHVARYLCDRVGVMYFGKLVELGTVDQIFDAPRHPYTRALLGTLEDELRGAGGPETFAPPGATGCRYASRCPHATALCVGAHPPMEAASDGHDVACHRWREIDFVRPTA